jgi:hypothetical protein
VNRISLVLAAVGLLLLQLATATGAAAQRVEITGGEDLPQVQEVRRMLERGDFLLLVRDTVLEPESHVTRDVLIADAEVRISGRVDGAVAVLGGALFVRPTARISGRVVGLGGGVFPSMLAETGEVLESPLGYRVEVESTPELITVRVIAPPPPPRVEVLGLFGLRFPAYDRVSGLTLGWNPTVRPFRDGRLIARPWVGIRTARGDLVGGIEAEGVVGRIRYSADLERATQTTDGWIRREWTNTPAALLLGSDARDYHHSDRVRFAVSPAEELVWRGFLVTPEVELQASRDRSLDTRNPWSLFGSLDRPNPPIDEGTLVSVRPGVEIDWRGGTSETTSSLALERGLGGPGDFAFTQWQARARYRMEAFWGHSIRFRAFAMGTLGDDLPAPRQRWSYVGGSALIPTVPIEDRQIGDHVVYLDSQYRVPLEFVQLPFLGSPHLRITHRTGAAWITGEEMPGWEQALGAGVGLFLLHVDAFFDPAGNRGWTLAWGIEL